MMRSATPKATSFPPRRCSSRWVITPARTSMRRSTLTSVPGAIGIDQVAAGELLSRCRLPRPVAQAVEIRHLDRRPAEGGSRRRRDHPAEGHGAAAHGLLSPLLRHRRLSDRLSRPHQEFRSLAWPQGHHDVRGGGCQPRGRPSSTTSRCTTSVATLASRMSKAS